MANRSARTPEKEREFLDALAAGLSVTKSSKACGIGRRTVYSWRSADEEFSTAWESAYEQGSDALEDEAYHRAVEGIEKPVGWYQGKPGGTVTEYSDTLLIFLLKGRRPEKFAESRRVHMTGQMKHEHSRNYDLSKLSDDDLNTVERILASSVHDKDEK